jgi:transcriptional regulator with XRE-family HTH domain
MLSLEVVLVMGDKPSESNSHGVVIPAAPIAADEKHYEEQIANLGRKLRDLRHAQSMSLEELVDRTGLSIGLLSQIERGKGNPSFVTLMKVADAFGVQMSYFFSDDAENHIVVRKDQRRTIFFPASGLTYELLTPDVNRRVEVIFARLEPGVRTQDSPFSHEGEECIVLIRGTLEAHIGDEVFTLQAGDAITFDCSLPHWYYNPGPDAAETFGAMTPPSW